MGTEGSQDQDLSFRVTELLDCDRIAHIPHILYHWRVHEESTASSFLAKPYVIESGRKVYLDAASRQGRKSAWVPRANHGRAKFLYYPNKRYLCSVILLVDDILPSSLLFDTIKELGKYVDVELHAQPLGAASPKIKTCSTLPYVGEELAHACNEAAAKVKGDIVLFLSAALNPDRDCRLEQLIEIASAPHVAMASGNIWHDKKLVCGGWYPNVDGLPFPLLKGMDKNEVLKSIWGQMDLPRHCIGVPWECMAVKKEFCQAGNFLDECFGSLATVDFALRALRQNKFAVMNPWVNWQTTEMSHVPNEAEIKYMFDHWGREIAACGLRNPNLRAAPDNDWTIIL